MVGVLPAQEQSEEDIARDRIRRIQDELFEDSMRVVAGAMKFTSIPLAADGSLMKVTDPPPWDWMEKYGGEEACKLWRAAHYATMTKKEAPVGLEMAARVAVGIARANALHDAGPKTLNVVQIAMTAPMPVFETVQLPEDSK